MSERPSRLRRAFEWLWRKERLRELRQRGAQPLAPDALEEAKSCQTLAWRALAGLEPIAARTRDTVARPLILTGILKALPLTGTAHAKVDDVFVHPAWHEHLARSGLDSAVLPAVHAWLLQTPIIEPDAGSRESMVSSREPLIEGIAQPSAADQALLALNAVIDAIEGPGRAVRGILWRRAALVLTSLAALAALVAGVAVLLTPPEGRDLAVGKPWQTSSFYPGFLASGPKPANPKEGAFFSTTNEEASPWWMVDLQVPTRIGSVTVVNRSDCCLERAHPVALEVSLDGKTWKEVSRRTELFRTWHPSFTPVNARYVRLRGLRRTHLHFKDVRVHPARAGK